MARDISQTPRARGSAGRTRAPFGVDDVTSYAAGLPDLRTELTIAQASRLWAADEEQRLVLNRWADARFLLNAGPYYFRPDWAASPLDRHSVSRCGEPVQGGPQ
jgi:hypothetical protein